MLDLKIPEDISLVGFNDYQFSQYTNPSLTTMVHMKNKMGFDAAKLLMKQLNNETVVSVVYAPRIVYRASVTNPPLND